MNKMLRVLLVVLSVYIFNCVCLAETTILVVPRHDNQTQNENAEAAAKVLNDWEKSNTNREVVFPFYVVNEIARPKSCNVTAWLMITRIIVTHKPKCDCK